MAGQHGRPGRGDHGPVGRRRAWRDARRRTSWTARCRGSPTWPSTRWRIRCEERYGHRERRRGAIARVNGPLVEVTGLDRRGDGRHRRAGRGPAARRGRRDPRRRDHRAGVRVHRRPGARAARPGPRGDRCRPGSGPHCSAASSTGCCARSPGRPPGWSPATRCRGADRRDVGFTPEAPAGAVVAGGTSLGTVDRRRAGIAYRVLVPPGLCRAPWTACATPGRYRRRGDRDRVRRRTVRPDLGVAGAPPPAVPRARWTRGRAAAHRPARDRRAVPGRARAAAAAVPGGFGTGKTVLLQQIAKWCDADVIVYVGLRRARQRDGRRARASSPELTDPRTGGRLTDRTVIIANTSNMPMMAREASIYTGDHGRRVLPGHGATTPWSSPTPPRAGPRRCASSPPAPASLPAEEGYPAEPRLGPGGLLRAGRAGPHARRHATGSVTIVGAVSPPGGDLTEPVTAHTERFVRCLWSLDRDLAYARHYPAVAWSGSFSRRRRRARRLARRPRATPGGPERRGRAGRAARRGRPARRPGRARRRRPPCPAASGWCCSAGRLLREGVLQQNALSAHRRLLRPARDRPRGADSTSVLRGGGAACRQLIEAAVYHAAALEETDFAPVLRAREEPPTTGGAV